MFCTDSLHLTNRLASLHGWIETNLSIMRFLVVTDFFPLKNKKYLAPKWLRC